MRLIICPWSFPISFVATVSQGDPWSSTWEPPCCVRVGSRWFPSSQPPLFAAPQYQAASVWPSCRSGVRLKRTLQTFIQTCLKLSSSQQTQGVMRRGFYRRCELRVWWAASASCSSAETASSVLSISLRKLDCTRVGRANSSTRQKGQEGQEVRKWSWGVCSVQ